MPAGRVAGLARHPLKNAAAEAVDVQRFGAHGPDGDRVWACVDARDPRDVLSAKDPRTGTVLLGVGTRWENAPAASRPPDGGRLVLRVGDDEVVAGEPAADAALSAALDRDVHLTRHRASGARMRRRAPDDAGLVPDWTPYVVPGSEYVAALAAPQALPRFLDLAPVHLVTTGGLDALAAGLGRPVDAAHLRPNLLVDLSGDPEPGTVLDVGAVRLRVVLPTPRCIVPAVRAGGPLDRDLLSTPARGWRRDVPGMARAACFGVYADVVSPGVVRVGDRVAVR